MILGVLDVGSNTINLQIMDAHHGAAPNAKSSFKRELKLIQYLEENGEISRTGIDLLTSAINEVFNESANLEIHEILAFATSAIREAINVDSILTEVLEKTNIELQILSGIEEASFTFLAVRRWLGWSAGNLLVLDIGGGSLEIAFGNQENPEKMFSLPLGAGRLTRTFLQGDPFTPKSINMVHKYLESSLENVAIELNKMNMHSAVGTSKTFRTLTRLQNTYLPQLGQDLTLKGLDLLVPKLSSMSLNERKNLSGLSSSRAEQIVAGALVAQITMKELQIESIEICPWALREGIVLQRLDWLKS